MKKYFYSFLVLLLAFNFVKPVFANEESFNKDGIFKDYNEEENLLIVDDSMTNSEQNAIIDGFLANPELESLIVLNASELLEVHVPYDDIKPKARLGVNMYKVNNIRNGSDVTGTSAIATAIGEPGVTIGISQTKSVATTISSSYGASNSALNASIGWDVTKSTSVLITGSVKVPNTVNGKKVAKLALKAYSVYKTKKFDVHKMPWYSIYWDLEGTGTANKANGVEYKKTYTYK
ncbi:hypothetical protein AN960_16950 [Bacillus sp. FJAT-25509]|uniref:hypothetical protein n=1 Tax=Bacillus sp. FJAT-25509 TaxID=1712029 RepID=UPI0006FB9088|nr:hypothetical protein [Bacillus sp. FJAT-25509]KQL36304.1 hypothetical protein AN960_16950 [Bacillus sp. FJAT-25509]